MEVHIDRFFFYSSRRHSDARNTSMFWPVMRAREESGWEVNAKLLTAQYEWDFSAFH